MAVQWIARRIPKIPAVSRRCFVGFILVMLLCGYLNFALVSILPKARFWLNLLDTGYMIYLGIHIALTKQN